MPSPGQLLLQFSWLTPYLRLQGKAQTGHSTTPGRVHGVVNCFHSECSATSLQTHCFLPWNKGHNMGEERKGKSPGLRPPNSYSNTAAKRWRSCQVHPACAVSSLPSPLYTPTQGNFHWDLLSWWYFVCNLLFMSNQNKHLELYGKRSGFHMWRKWVVSLSNKTDYEGKNIGN